MMNNMLTLVSAGIAGVILGVIFFGGLWWTVRKGVSSRQPALLFLASWLLRTGIVLAGFFLVANSHLDRLLTCLIGFAIARFFVMRYSELPSAYHQSLEHEASHEAKS